MQTLDRTLRIACCALVAAFFTACDEPPPADEEDVSDVARDVEHRPGPDVSDDATDGTTDDPRADDTSAGDTPEELDAVWDVPEVETACHDGIDDDRDGRIDCADDDCAGQCEVCNDLVDNDDDGLIDCLDDDCASDDACPERCQNDEDDDGDGDIDCGDSECARTVRCAEDPVSADDWVFGDTASYLYSVQYPPAGVSCCFDYNDDGRPDNNLVNVLSAIPGYDPQRNMDAVVNGGDVGILLEWTETPDDLGTGGAVSFNIHRAIPVSPAPPSFLTEPVGPDTNLWRDGDGVFRVYRDSFDARGPRIRFSGASIADGMLTAGPDLLNLTIPIPELGFDLDVILENARIEIALADDTDPSDRPMWVSVPDYSSGTRVGGGRLGGTVRADDIFGFLNVGAASCTCARPAGATGALIEYGEVPDPARYEAECGWTPLESGDAGYYCSSGSSPLCPTLKQLCRLLPLIPLMLDVDVNKNGAKESLSVGLLFDLTGAHLDATPLAD